MNYPKEFYVTAPIDGDKVWLAVETFCNGKTAFHGPWWIDGVYPFGIRLRRVAGPKAIVDVTELLRMSKTQIKKMAVLKSPV